jgi:hypothetical protein
MPGCNNAAGCSVLLVPRAAGENKDSRFYTISINRFT